MTFKRTTLEETLAVSPLLVLDGAMSTPLENMGIDLNTKLWTAKVLADQPEMVKQVHKNYFKAGADCGITCSYQATVPGLMDIGYTKEQAEELIAKSVEIFLEAREEWWQEEGEKAGHTWPLCLASVGPYGAYLADGSEYRGHYEVSEETLYEFHKHRMELLWEAGADLLLLETQPSLREALVEAKIAEEMGADYWISFSCGDDKHINEGTKIAECARAFSRDPHKYPHRNFGPLQICPLRYTQTAEKNMTQSQRPGMEPMISALFMTMLYLISRMELQLLVAAAPQ